LAPACCLFLVACTLTTGVFEKNVAIPGHQWQSSFQPELVFNIQDTTSLYNIYFVIRHTDAYHFNNIWISASVRQPGDTAALSQKYDLTLSSNDKGWLGSAMDDIWEQRVLLQPLTKFSRAGDYHFSIRQIMREDPLKEVLNAGIRVEKVRQ